MAVPKILYKYLSAKGFQRFWDSEKVRFTQLNQLNDPYENQFLFSNLDLDFDTNELENILVKIAKVSSEYRDMLKNYKEMTQKKIVEHCEKYQNQINNKYGILSLTRNCTNLLIWSHYADEYKGVVIGLDMDHEFFKNTNFVIPPSSGNIIYSAIKPIDNIIQTTKYTVKENGKDLKIEIGSPDLESKVYQEFVFLYKSINWAYEEEVRIVIDYAKHHDIEVVKNNIKLLQIPKNAIKCLIFGDRFDRTEFEQIANKSISNKEGIDFIKTSIDKNEYKLNFNKYTPN